MEIAIAGGGIGGLAAALTLHRLGMRVVVLERTREIQPLGVGINLLPHGAAVLHQLGLRAALDRTGIRTRAIEYRTQYGQLIQSDSRAATAASPFPQYSIHRGELQMLLLRAALAELPAGSIRTGLRCDGLVAKGSRVAIHLTRESGAAEQLEADALIGADGVDSAVCSHLHGVLPLRFSGTMMWRGAVEQAPFLDGETMVIAGHHDTKAVIYPISQEARARGRSLVNWVAELNVGPDAPHAREDWNRRGDASEFAAAFADWQFPFIDVPALFRATERIFVYPMVDRDPLPFWSRGRISLLGDAAHPMMPIGANGASQAVLDADALGAAFAEYSDPVEALASYAARRLPATAAVVASNRARGPEAVLQLARERVRGPQDDVSALITREELEAVSSGYRQIAGFDEKTLAQRAALAGH